MIETKLGEIIFTNVTVSQGDEECSLLLLHFPNHEENIEQSRWRGSLLPACSDLSKASSTSAKMAAAGTKATKGR